MVTSTKLKKTLVVFAVGAVEVHSFKSQLGMKTTAPEIMLYLVVTRRELFPWPDQLSHIFE